MIYDKHMSKQAISVTLGVDNVTWLKGRAGASGVRSVSELLDRLVTAARQSGDVGPSRSVVGTIDIDPGDPLLERADEAVRSLFESSLGRPLMVKETSPGYGAPGRRRGPANCLRQGSGGQEAGRRLKRRG
jgi:hypothetical protein